MQQQSFILALSGAIRKTRDPAFVGWGYLLTACIGHTARFACRRIRGAEVQ